MKTIKRFIRDESGTTALEWGLVASLVAVATIAGFRSLGSQLNLTLGDITTALTPTP